MHIGNKGCFPNAYKYKTLGENLSKFSSDIKNHVKKINAMLIENICYEECFKKCIMGHIVHWLLNCS